MAADVGRGEHHRRIQRRIDHAIRPARGHGDGVRVEVRGPAIGRGRRHGPQSSVRAGLARAAHPAKVWMVTDRQPRTRVAVVFGGTSSEHGVSCLTAAGVLGALDPDRYDVVGIGITRQRPLGAGRARRPSPRLQVSDGRLPELSEDAERRDAACG